MPIPIRLSSIKLVDKWPTSIIIHHTGEKPYAFASSVDTAKFQTGKFELGVLRKEKKYNTDYHIIIEKQDNDFYPIISRPLFSKTEWEDIPNRYNNSIHIAVYGDYNSDIPMTRMYQILAFKVLFPLTTLFRINEKNILLHREISDIKIDCPGTFFDKSKLISAYRRYKRMKSITRG